MKTIILVTAFSCLLGAFAVPGDAAIFKYTDKDGVLSFADDLQSVPEQYRSTAVIVEGESEEEGTKAISGRVQDRAETPARTEPSLQRRKPAHPFTSRLLISATVVFSAVLAFIFLAMQPGLREKRKILSGVRSALIAAVSLYLVFAHARDLVTIFGFAGRAIDGVQQQSAEKGRKAAQAMKMLDALFEEAQKAGEEPGIAPEEHR